MKRDETRTEALLADPPGPVDSIEELSNRCVPTLRARIWETCCWSSPRIGRSNIGDYRFLILEFCPSGDEDACLYVQFWSEPEEPG
jgi:hypothetical protein